MLSLFKTIGCPSLDVPPPEGGMILVRPAAGRISGNAAVQRAFGIDRIGLQKPSSSEVRTILKIDQFPHRIIVPAWNRPTKTISEVTMVTGKRAASDAAKILRNPKSTKKEKEVAASDLAQRKGAPAAKPKKK